MSETGGNRLSVGLVPRLVLAGAAALMIVVPYDFVTVRTAMANAVTGSMLAGLAAANFVLFRAHSALPTKILAAWLAIGGVATLANGGLVQFILMTAPLAIGVALGLTARRPSFFVGLLLVSISASLVVERQLGAHIFSEFWGEPRFVSFAEASLFRPRGILGASLVAGSVAAILGVYYLFRPGLKFRFGLVVLLLTGGSIVLSGSRSPLIGLGVVILIRVAALLRGARVPAPAVLAGIVATLGGFVAVLGFEDKFAGLRAFSFDRLGNSVSVQNREQALGLLSVDRDCAVSCVAFGDGPRSLGDYLRTTSQFDFSTVDNTWVTLYWEYGIFAVLGWTVLGLALLRRAVVKDATDRSATYALIAFFVFSFFLELIYLRVGALTLGFMLGLLPRFAGTDSNNDLDHNRELQHPGQALGPMSSIGSGQPR